MSIENRVLRGTHSSGVLCKHTQDHSIVKLSESQMTRITRITRILKSLLSRIFMKFREFHGESNSSVYTPVFA